MSLYGYSSRNKHCFHRTVYKLFPLLLFVFAITSCADDPVSSPLPIEQPDLIITAIVPDSAYVNDDIVITGKNFSIATSANVVTFAGGVQGRIIAATSTSLIVTVPDGAQSGKISLSVLDKSCESVSEFAILGTNTRVEIPLITAIVPGSAYIDDDIVITGENFSMVTSDNVVTFAGGVQGKIIAATSTSLVVTIPDGAQSGKISLSVLDKSCESVSELTILDMNMQVDIPLEVSSKVGIGDIITLNMYGTELPDLSKVTVRFGNAVAEILPQSSSTKLFVRVPVGAVSGPITVKARGKTVQTSRQLTIITRMLPYKNCLIEITGLRMQIQSKISHVSPNGTETVRDTTYWTDFEMSIDSRSIKPYFTIQTTEQGFIDNVYQLSYSLTMTPPGRHVQSYNIAIVLSPTDHAITDFSVSDSLISYAQGGHTSSSNNEDKTLAIHSLHQTGSSNHEYVLTGDMIRSSISQLLYSKYDSYFSPGSGEDSTSKTLVSYECPSTAKITIKFLD
jgi:hypothetical protein